MEHENPTITDDEDFDDGACGYCGDYECLGDCEEYDEEED